MSRKLKLIMLGVLIIATVAMYSLSKRNSDSKSNSDSSKKLNFVEKLKKRKA